MNFQNGVGERADDVENSQALPYRASLRAWRTMSSRVVESVELV